jgi:Tfp pilus assembly protein FimT
LIELILVMGLTMVLMAIAAPRLDGFTRGRVLRCQGDDLLSLLNTARDRSAAEAAVYRVNIADGVCSLQVRGGGAFAAAGTGITDRITLAAGVTAEMERLDGDASATWVEFQPTGQCTAARITLSDVRGNKLYVAARSALEPFRVTDTIEDTNP